MACYTGYDPVLRIFLLPSPLQLLRLTTRDSGYRSVIGTHQSRLVATGVGRHASQPDILLLAAWITEKFAVILPCSLRIEKAPWREGPRLLKRT